MSANSRSYHECLVRSTRRGPPLRILVTGELCGQLAERGHAVIALVHRTRRILRNDGRTMEPAPYARTRLDDGAVLAVHGDVRKDRLGLEREAASVLASTIDLVVHCAAETGFQLAPGLHRSVNIEGTANVIAFARCAKGSPPGLVHISTAYVSGERSGAIMEDELDVGQVFANDYEATKAAAESLVHASGLRAAIARPSIVVGASETGAIGRFENIYAFLKLIGSGRVAVLPTAPDASLDLVPIDHVINGLIDLVERFEDAAGRTFHLVSGDPAPIAALVALDYPGFHVPQLASSATFDPSRLDPLQTMIYENVTSLYAAYLRRDPHFAAANLRALSGRMCPPTGPRFLRRIVDYAARAGYLRPNLTIRSKCSSLI
ncbi:Male sterility protein [Rhizobiales bacterium GAS191]|nr:Male sterility protein [Rhizobiales bacterium GAS191]